jgi:putative transcriptional regulator
MNINHHPSIALLLDYSCGNLPNLFDGVLKAHVDVCAKCTEVVQDAERLGGELMSVIGHKESKPIAMHRERYGGMDDMPYDNSRAEKVCHDGNLEKVVSTYLDSSLNALPWRSLGEGLRLCRLAKEDNMQMWMLRGKPGVALPVHSHKGSELTLVMKGAYFCGSQIFQAGDIEEADETVEHQPVITSGGECICLAVTEGQLEFKKILPRIVQKFVGI